MQKQELTPEEYKKLVDWNGPGFDLRTHIFNPKDGSLVKNQPYRMTVSRGEGTWFERDGKKYTEQGKEIGKADVKAKADPKTTP